MTMFDGLTMVSYDGHNRNKMMVDHVWTMVDHGRPWSGGQMFAGVIHGQDIHLAWITGWTEKRNAHDVLK